MKSTYSIQVYKSMVPLKNSIKSTNVLYTGSYKIFPVHYFPQGNFLKSLYCTKHNEINIGHSDIQKHRYYTRPHETFLIFYEVCLEML